MYLDNVRDKLSSLSYEDQRKVATEARDLLVNLTLIKPAVRPKEAFDSLTNFINRKDTKVYYLEGFLLALDSLYPEGGKRALLGEKLDSRHTWRNLLIRITNDVPSPILDKYKDDPHIIKEFKQLFISLNKKCLTDDKDETLHMLQVLNRVFSE
ncbi:hypothetical protein [Fictibacillus barbaricus]|uniref:Uncharacterized protein n=1 Tax=Fictibacillus barbaricus TaxID=182136 RepID=A0ABS2ZIJ1_9BACL|nr:hypothetical protein [Fictibacillus barbaricus]MBN3547960.1 hypothetical protein [Fictibacillus barbaricus]GGB52892.1 hypothetical protein GCM10007199_18450 [Fictibacillus barbaricus]